MNNFKTHGTCASQINYEVDENNIVTSVEFVGGCGGNTKGLSNLIVGMKAEDVVAKLKGTPCRFGTSCPDQLAKALEQHLNNKK